MKTVIGMPTMKQINAMDNSKGPTAASFFSGCGGASIGMKLAGYNVVFANEFVPQAADTYDLNSRIKVDRRDIRKVSGKDVLKRIGLKRGELDLLEGSPPCKSFSATQARKAGREFGEVVKYSEGIMQRVDDLFFEFVRILTEIKPKVFIAENVKGLAKHINRGYFVEIHRALEAAGYVVEAKILDASRLGVPQQRERLIFMGVRRDLHKAGYVHPWCKPSDTEMTVQRALPHIVRIKTGRGYGSALNPSPTITASDHSIGETANFSCGGFVEDDEGVNRKYTIPELLVISSVPRDFKFPSYEDESENKRFQRSWERLGRIHVPLQVYHLTKAIRTGLLEKL